MAGSRSVGATRATRRRRRTRSHRPAERPSRAARRITCVVSEPYGHAPDEPRPQSPLLEGLNPIQREAELIGPEDYTARAHTHFERTVGVLYGEYQRRLKAAGALDFDDIIMETHRLFDRHPAVLEHYQERFRYVLIDEYQDTNRAQYHLVNLLAGAHHNLCVVGAADQGVYSRRRATIRHLLDFEHDSPY